jgi:hypothetical protein
MNFYLGNNGHPYRTYCYRTRYSFSPEARVSPLLSTAACVSESICYADEIVLGGGPGTPCEQVTPRSWSSPAAGSRSSIPAVNHGGPAAGLLPTLAVRAYLRGVTVVVT